MIHLIIHIGGVKVGHGGTLDPMATGVLVIGVGRGCKKLQEFLINTNKRYQTIGQFGVSFDTDDTSGLLLEEAPFEHITETQVREELINSFTGTIMQRPPSFSAKQVNGKRAYKQARERQRQLKADPLMKEDELTPELILPERQITISHMELATFDLPFFALDMEVSSGTYVRSICRDLGVNVGSLAAMTALRRVQQGIFSLDQCLEMEELDDLDTIEKAIAKFNDGS